MGWKVRVGHHRKYFRFCSFTGKKQELLLLKEQHDNAHKEYYLSATGGVTTIAITIPELNIDTNGVAECSDLEHYSRNRGLTKALARALSSIQKHLGFVD